MARITPEPEPLRPYPPSILMAIETFCSVFKILYSLMARPLTPLPHPLNGLAISGRTFFSAFLIKSIAANRVKRNENRSRQTFPSFFLENPCTVPLRATLIFLHTCGVIIYNYHKEIITHSKLKAKMDTFCVCRACGNLFQNYRAEKK